MRQKKIKQSTWCASLHISFVWSSSLHLLTTLFRIMSVCSTEMNITRWCLWLWFCVFFSLNSCIDTLCAIQMHWYAVIVKKSDTTRRCFWNQSEIFNRSLFLSFDLFHQAHFLRIGAASLVNYGNKLSLHFHKILIAVKSFISKTSPRLMCRLNEQCTMHGTGYELPTEHFAHTFVFLRVSHSGPLDRTAN